MAAAVELEIGLHRKDAHNWTVELRGSLPKDDVDIRLVGSARRPDLEALRQHVTDDSTYGRLLGESLFADADVLGKFAEARAAAETQGLPLRVRLFIGPSAPELHELRWETLRDPRDGTALVTNERILFSRFLSSADWRPVAVRPTTLPRALVMVANPSGMEQWRGEGRDLAAIDAAAELERATAALGRAEVTGLGSDRRATLEGLVACLRDGQDIVYLVCHGFLAGERNEPQLLLENDAGSVARVPGSMLVERLRKLRHLPSLVVLASCQSAGRGNGLHSEDQGALAALGPRLAEAGVPAVVAMQGNVSMATVAELMPVFFRELHRDGQIDRALAVARSTIQGRPDWWVPALFMRLKSGRIWYRPGFVGEAFEKWPALFRDIRADPCKCVPILGPGLTDALLGTRHELAQRWASSYHFPMAPHARDDLPQVAQYLAVSQNLRFPRDTFRQYLREELLERYRDKLPAEVRQGPPEQVMTAVGEYLRAVEPAEPHKVLALLPFPIYVTTHPATLLSEALVAVGKKPEVEFCRWQDDGEVNWPPSVYDRDPAYRPDARRPLVLHLFGRLEDPGSLVLTEDHYLDFLIAVTANKHLIPSRVRHALADSSLLFLGFRIDEWDFRVVFRSIMNQEGRARRGVYSHVAAQIDPEERQTLEPERARRYLERYFEKSDTSIYWGSVEDFIREAHARWEREPA